MKQNRVGASPASIIDDDEDDDDKEDDGVTA